MRATAFFAMAIMLAANAAFATPTPTARASVPIARTARVVEAGAHRGLLTASAAGRGGGKDAPTAAGALRAVEVLNRNTNARAAITLYGEDGTLDRGAARAFMRVAGRSRAAPDDAGDEDERLDLRLVQLAIRAAYHFGGAPIRIVSATRPGARGKHGSGEALDFALDGVKASVLAAHLRTLPRAGVGIYTHPRTQYVHLDVRDQSYHWIDASPPGVTWRERLVPDPKRAARDEAWSAAADLPEPQLKAR